MKKDEYIEKYGEEAYQKKLEQSRKWRQDHLEQCREQCRMWKREHPEQDKELVKKWKQDHHERFKELNRNSARQNKHMFAYVVPEEKCLIENYNKALADNFNGWSIHHRLETHTSDGEIRPVFITKKELIALKMYYNRPASELIFLTMSEHMKLHRSLKKR